MEKRRELTARDGMGNTVRTILFCADIADGTRTERKHEVKTMKPLPGLLVRKLLTRGIA